MSVNIHEGLLNCLVQDTKLLTKVDSVVLCVGFSSLFCTEAHIDVAGLFLMSSSDFPL